MKRMIRVAAAAAVACMCPALAGAQGLDSGDTAWVAETRSYLWGPVRRTEALQENFTFGALPAGRYVLERVDGGPASRAEVTVEAGRMTVVTLRP